MCRADAVNFIKQAFSITHLFLFISLEDWHTEILNYLLKFNEWNWKPFSPA